MTKLLNKLSEKLGEAKIKLGKKAMMALALLLSLIVVIIFISSFQNKTIDSVNQTEKIDNENTMDFISKTERRLETILSSIKGAGDVKVFVMASESSEIIFASDEDIKESGEGVNKTISASKAIVFTKDGSKTETIVSLEIYPEITGVLVVAEGANDEKRRLMILNAVSVALNLENSKIEVLAGEKSK